jgi:hypothetical protein
MVALEMLDEPCQAFVEERFKDIAGCEILK